MKVCDRRKLVFIHITKTAGVSVGEALGFGAEVDDARHDVKGRTPIVYRDYLRLCFVRNPWERAYSAFRYTKKMTALGRINGDAARLFVESRPEIDFRAFAADFLAKREVDRILHFRRQLVWIRRGQPQFIGRVERLDDDLTTLSRVIGEALSARQLNEGPPRDSLDEVYDARTREIVGEIYRADARFLNYRFPDPAEAERAM